MERESFGSLIRSGAASFGVKLDEEQGRRLYSYFLELRRWSKKINLIARETVDKDIVEKHFIDSLVLLDLLPDSGVRLLDIGSGAGFPGLVCKAARPDLTVHLVEPRLKRVSFLRHIIRQLKLSDIEVHGCRLEDGSISEESSFNWVVSRAVADIGGFLALCDRFKNYGSSVVCMKGPGYLDELDERRELSNGWQLETTRTYRLPFSGARRALLVYTGL
jgi:16S rRNA (guanine527-N7)-methyltransferase